MLALVVPIVTRRVNAACFFVLGIAALAALTLHVRAKRRLGIATAKERSPAERIADRFR